MADIVEKLQSMISGGQGIASTDEGMNQLFAGLKNFLTTSNKNVAETTKSFDSTFKAMASGSKTDLLKSFNNFNDTFNKTFNTAASQIIGFVANTAGKILQVTAGAHSFINKRITEISGGIAGAYTAMGNTISSSLKAVGSAVGGELGKGISEMGGMIGQLLSTAGNAYLFMYEDYIAKARTVQLTSAQTGILPGGMRGRETTATEAFKNIGLLGRKGAEEWGSAMVKQGVVFESDMTLRMAKVGKAFGISSGETSELLSQFINITGEAAKAGTALESSFGYAVAAAQGTNIPVLALQKNIAGAASAARFLNVDFKTVAGTMQYLTENQKKFQAAGVSIREDGGKILKELSAGTNKWTDSLHAFFGTKGGMEGSPIEGLMKSKFGTEFASTLQSTGGGGFTAKGGQEGTMMLQRLDVMKETMMEASKGASNDQEALYMQMKVATETFGMSEETAKVLAMGQKDDLRKMAENPKMMDQFKSQKDILSELKDTSVHQEAFARTSAYLADEQLKLLANQLTYAMITAAGVMRLKPSDLGISEEDIRNSVRGGAEAMKNMFESVTKQAVAFMPAETRKAIERPMDLTKSMLQKMAMLHGGSVFPAQTGRNVYSVAEDGRPEIYSGGGDNILFSPASAGKIYNANETMGIFKRGLQGSPSQGMSMKTEKSGNTINMNLTINAGTLDRGKFARLLEEEVLNTLYG